MDVIQNTRQPVGMFYPMLTGNDFPYFLHCDTTLYKRFEEAKKEFKIHDILSVMKHFTSLRIFTFCVDKNSSHFGFDSLTLLKVLKMLIALINNRFLRICGKFYLFNHIKMWNFTWWVGIRYFANTFNILSQTQYH